MGIIALTITNMDFNPRPPRGGRRGFLISIAGWCISIHAPREGGDRKNRVATSYAIFISIHAPREGGDKLYYRIAVITINFNPRPPRGGRQVSRLFDYLK